MSNETSIDLKQCVLDAVLSGLIALVVFGPIVGVVLDGYGFNLHYERVGWIIAIVMAGRFLLSLYLQTRGGRPSRPWGRKIRISTSNEKANTSL